MSDATEPSWQRDVQGWITRTASSIDDVVDGALRRLRARLGRSGIPQVQPYMGYASKELIRLHGRVLTNPPIDPNFKTDGWWEDLTHTIQRIFSDEVPNVRVQALAEGVSDLTTSDAEGYFHFELDRGKFRPCESLYWMPAELRIEGQANSAVQNRPTICNVMVVPPSAEFGVISDVDDTILHTGATSILTMAKLTFFGNARTRAPLDGVAKLYEKLQDGVGQPPAPRNPIFYVSSSPWNLYDMLEDFLSLNAIPKGPLLLRDLGFDANKFLASGHDHKLHKAKAILNRFSELPFVLFGDSGQDDPRLYAEAAKEFGDRIRAIFIRDIGPDENTERDTNVDHYAAIAGRAGVPMFKVKDSVEAAEIAIDHTLLPANALSEIKAATAREQARQEGVGLP